MDSQSEHAKTAKTRPKRPVPAFIFYSIERKQTLKHERPDLPPFGLQRQCAIEWNELPNSAREPYIRKAKLDKMRYDFEVNQLKDTFVLEFFYLVSDS